MKKLVLVVGIFLFIGGLFLMLKNDKDIQEVEFVEINGIKVPLIFEQSELLPIGNVQLVFNGGGSVFDWQNASTDSVFSAKDSIQAKAGLASLAVSLLNAGTKELGNVGFAEKLESKAVSLRASASTRILSFDLSFLNQYKDFALDCLVELLSNPNTTDEAFDKVKTLAHTSILAKQNDFDYIAGVNLNKIFFSGTPLSFERTIESIQSIHLSDIEQYLSKNIVLNRLIIVAGGDLDKEELKQDLSKRLSLLPNGEIATKPNINPHRNLTHIESKKPTQQAYIYFSSPFNADVSEAYKTKVMSFVLGGSGFGSRIMEEVRVKRGLAYSAYFSIIGSSDVINYGTGHLQTGLDSKDEALRVVREVMENFVQNGITQEELDAAKDFILGSEPLREETLSQRLNAKFNNYFKGLPLDNHKRDIQKIATLTLDEINTFIKSHKEILDLSVSIVDSE